VLRAVVGNPALRRVLAAYFAFNAAEFGTWVAILVFAYEASGPAAVGVVALVQLLPAAAFAPFAASFADRYPRERVLLAGYVVQAAAYAATGAAMLLGAPPPIVYLSGACLAGAITFTRPAQGALLPALAKTPEELTAANSVAGTVEGLGTLVGPLVAAGIMAVSGPGEVWVAGGITALVAAVLVGRLPRPATVPGRSGALHGHAIPAVDPALGPRQAAGPTSANDAIGDPRDHDHGVVLPSEPVGGGLRALAGAGHARVVVGLLAVRMLTFGAIDVLFVLLALEVFGTGDSGAGILTAALGLGAILGGAASLSLIGRQRLAPAMALSAAVWAVPMVIVGTVAPAAAAPFLIIMSGIGFAALDVTGRTLLQRVTPDRLLARVLGALEGIGLVFLSIGSVMVPVLAGWVGVESALVVVALLIPVGVAIAWVSLLHIDGHAHVPVRELGVLRLNPIFVPLPAPQLEAVARRTRWVTLRTGEVLIREGDAGDRFYVLESGELRVTIKGAFLRVTDGPGEGIGEIALMSNVPRTATVTATVPCVLLALERDDFLTVVTGHDASHRLAEETAAGRAMSAPDG
jgi:MFS family permease